MARYSEFPSGYVAGIQSLSELNNDSFDILRKGLDDGSVTISIRDLVSVAKRVPGINKPEALIQMLIGLSATVDRYGLDSVINNVRRSLENSEVLAECNAEAIVDKIKTLLAAPSSVMRFLKARRVISSHQHVFSECQILTDVRPIFNETGDNALGGAIIHNLKIEYRMGSERRQIFIALDDLDLKSLQEQVSRATIKSSTLQKVLSKSEITYLSPQEGQVENENS